MTVHGALAWTVSRIVRRDCIGMLDRIIELHMVAALRPRSRASGRASSSPRVDLHQNARPLGLEDTCTPPPVAFARVFSCRHIEGWCDRGGRFGLQFCLSGFSLAPRVQLTEARK